MSFAIRVVVLSRLLPPAYLVTRPTMMPPAALMTTGRRARGLKFFGKESEEVPVHKSRNQNIRRTRLYEQNDFSSEKKEAITQ